MMHSQKFFINVHTATLESRLNVLAVFPYTSNRNRLGLGLGFGLFTTLFYISVAHISRKRQYTTFASTTLLNIINHNPPQCQMI